MNQEVSKIDNSLMELQNTQKLCQTLMESPHYKKIGDEGIYAIVEMAKSVGINPLLALNGGMYFVHGKVEMSALMMNTLIRQSGHSITKDKKSDGTICILHGKRSDTGDTWVESFSVEDAKTAGIYRNQWLKYPKDMLFARALSRLARQLFPDIIKGCYVQGEIEIAPSLDESVADPEETIDISPKSVGTEGAVHLEAELLNFPDYKKQVYAYIERQELNLEDITIQHAEKMYAHIEKLRNEINLEA